MDFQTYAAQELTAVADKLADTAKKQLDAATAQLTANFEATIDRLRHDQSQIVSEHERLTANFEATIDRLRNDQSQIVNENERLTAENAALLWEKEQMLESAKAASRGPLIDRLADVFEHIAGSRTVETALVAAAHGLVGDFSRVAVFSGEKRLAQLGADTPLDPSAPSVIAFPITVRGERLATIFAQDETRPSGEGTRLADVLRRHVTLALERLTIELKAVSELRAYAQMLLDEVEYVFNADITASLSASERRERLSENLRCARQIFGQRVTLEGPAAAAVLDEVLSQILEGKGETPFGRELADVVTAPEPARA